MDKKRFLKNLFGWLLAVVIFYILFKTIYDNREQLRNWHWQINWFYASLTAITLFGAYLCGTQGWLEIIRGFGYNIKFHESFRVIYMANLARYVPGKVWQVVGMVGLAKEIGLPPQISLASFALVQAYALPASFILIPLALGTNAALSSLVIFRDIMYIFMAIVVILFLILFFRPEGLNWALNKVLKIFRQEPVEYRPSIKNRFLIFIWYSFNWILFGVSFHFFILALSGTTKISFIYSSGAYIAAYIMGYLSFLSPGGLGVREGVMSALLSPLLTPPVAATVSLINRIWITIAETIVSFLAYLTYKIKK
jgi:uncharacterized membrane protein YbhN (UPF0104 family)